MVELALPEGLQTIGDLRQLHLEGSMSFGRPEGGRLETIWTLDGETITLVWDAAGRVVSLPDGTDQGRIEVLRSALERIGRTPRWASGIERLVELAQSTVGVDVRDLDSAQRAILLALALANQRAFEFGEDDQGEATIVVRPLREWVKLAKNG